jgi:L-amino acid N-acyltransferase YncA
MQSTHEIAQVSIRRARNDDAASIARAWLEGNRALNQRNIPPDDQVLEFFSSRLRQQTDVFGMWIAEHEGRFAGWQGLQPCRPNPIAKMAESSTYVSADVKTRGVGRSLILYANSHAQEVGLEYIVGFIRAENSAMIRIVESSGWTLVGTLPNRVSTDVQYLYYAYAVPGRRLAGRELPHA